MNFYNALQKDIVTALEGVAASGAIPSGLDFARVAVEPPRDPAHGDVSTNAALVLARDAGLKPRELADRIVDSLRRIAGVTSAEVAGPGFINLRLSAEFWHARLAELLRAGTDYGSSELGRGEKVNVEYVSANPTGPMHVGHARGAVVGDVLASLLQKVGYDVWREYYVNDAGAQVDAVGPPGLDVGHVRLPGRQDHGPDALPLERHVDRLDRDGAAEDRIGCLVDHAHCAAPELRNELVATDGCGLHFWRHRAGRQRPALTERKIGPHIGCPASAGESCICGSISSARRNSSRQRSSRPDAQ